MEATHANQATKIEKTNTTPLRTRNNSRAEQTKIANCKQRTDIYQTSARHPETVDDIVLVLIHDALYNNLTPKGGGLIMSKA
ncbi:hypothetical protein Bca4012_064030 [Brassica carinata]